jgi:hypothetical protein
VRKECYWEERCNERGRIVLAEEAEDDELAGRGSLCRLSSSSSASLSVDRSCGGMGGSRGRSRSFALRNCVRRSPIVVAAMVGMRLVGVEAQDDVTGNRCGRSTNT